MVKIEDLIHYDDDVVIEYGIEGMHFLKFACIGQKDKDDLGGFLEDTLHRILDAGGSEDDVMQIMGARIPEDEEERREMEEGYGCYDIDLSYVLPGSIFLLNNT